MKKIIMLWLGLLLIFVEIPVKVLQFPAYIEFETPAPNTVDMVINSVIGDSLTLTFFSSVLGLLLLIIASASLMKIRNQTLLTEKIKKKNPFQKAVILGIVALILCFAYYLMPFILNSKDRYMTGFVLFVCYSLLKTFAMIAAGVSAANMCNCTENNAWNSVLIIFFLLSTFTSLVRDACYLYDLPRLSTIYGCVSLFFIILYSIMFVKRRKYLSIR